MDPESVLEKTTKGVEEIETRKHKLDSKLRPILITVNGKLTAGELAARFAQAGDAAALLDELLKNGFVRVAGGGAPAAGADPAKLKRAVAEATRFLSEALGPGADSLNQKIEAVKTLDELNAYLDSRRDALDMALGKPKAAVFWQKVGPLLG
jgi:hypothetical protein